MGDLGDYGGPEIEVPPLPQPSDLRKQVPWGDWGDWGDYLEVYAHVKSVFRIIRHTCFYI